MDMIIQVSWSLWAAFLEVIITGIEAALVAGPVTEGVQPGQRVSSLPELVGCGNHCALPKDHNHTIINIRKIERERTIVI